MIRANRSKRIVKLVVAVLATGAIYFTGTSIADAHEWNRPRARETYRNPVRDGRGWWHYHSYDRRSAPPPWAARWYRNKHWRHDHRNDWRDEWRDYWRRRDRRD